VLAGRRQPLRHERELEGARRQRNGDRRVVDPMAHERVASAAQQPLGNEVVAKRKGDATRSPSPRRCPSYVGVIEPFQQVAERAF